jgi:cation:H+ antiporter
MHYILSIGLLVVGFVFLVKGADFFVASSSSIARKFHVSPLVIGLTLVAFGTSLPELAVSFVASLTVEPGATADIAMGNVVGSNIVNISLILGLTALARPVLVSKTMHKKEFPYLIVSTFVILLLSLFFQSDTQIVRWESALLMLLFIGYVWLMIRTGKNDDESIEIPIFDMKKSIILLFIGILGVSLGGWMVTTGAKNIATDILVQFFSIPESKAITLVGLTIVAVGTSLPEMVTSIVAAKKGENEIAFGNLVGSNIFNILFILGLSGLVVPLGINSDVITDIYLMLGITVLAIVLAITKGVVNKKEGMLLVLVYIAYIVYIMLRAFAIV